MRRLAARRLGRFGRPRRRLRAGLVQLLCALAGLGLGLLLPRIHSDVTVASTRVTEVLVAVGFGVLGLVTIIFSLLFGVVQWAFSSLSPRLNLFRDDPIVVSRDLDVAQVTDNTGTVRVVLALPSWDDYLRIGLDDLLESAAQSPMVLLRARALLITLLDAAPPARQATVARRLQRAEELGTGNFQLIWHDATGEAGLASSRPVLEGTEDMGRT
jgi:uncharacterized membrane protein